MRVPLSWLREYVDFDLTPEQLAERLTVLGMEVKAHRALGRRLAGRRRRRAAHGREAPQRGPAVADDASASATASRSRSSAAPRTSRPASACPVALPGAVLPGGPADRADREDGRGQQRDALLGRRARPHVRCRRDPHPARRRRRSAARSSSSTATWSSTWTSSRTGATRCRMVGLAREVAAATGATVRLPEIEVAENGEPTADRLSVEVEEPGLCPRFVGRCVERRRRSVRRRIASRGASGGRDAPRSATSSTRATTSCSSSASRSTRSTRPCGPRAAGSSSGGPPPASAS